MAIPFVILFHMIGSANHVSMIYDEKKKPMANKDNSLTVISCNTCLMPEGLARANNLPFVEERLVKRVSSNTARSPDDTDQIEINNSETIGPKLGPLTNFSCFVFHIFKTTTRSK